MHQTNQVHCNPKRHNGLVTKKQQSGSPPVLLPPIYRSTTAAYDTIYNSCTDKDNSNSNDDINDDDDEDDENNSRREEAPYHINLTIQNSHVSLLALIDAVYPPLQCTECNVVSHTRQDQQKHFPTHPPRYHCLHPHCELFFRTKSALRFHISRTHLVQQITPNTTARAAATIMSINTSIINNNNNNNDDSIIYPQPSIVTGIDSLPTTPTCTSPPTPPVRAATAAVSEPETLTPPATAITTSTTVAAVPSPSPSPPPVIVKKQPSPPTSPSSSPIAPLLATTKQPKNQQQQQAQKQRNIMSSWRVSSFGRPPTSSRAPRGSKKIVLSPQVESLLNSVYHPLQCPSCHQHFNRKTNVIKHLTDQHYGEEPYRCVFAECLHPKLYATREGLVYHILRVHDQQSDDNSNIDGNNNDTSKISIIHPPSNHFVYNQNAINSEIHHHHEHQDTAKRRRMDR